MASGGFGAGGGKKGADGKKEKKKKAKTWNAARSDNPKFKSGKLNTQVRFEGPIY